MIIIHQHGHLESLPRQDLPHNSAMLTSFLPLEGFYDFQNKIPATSVRQKPFSKLSHVAHTKWLS
jgi:hypothetical protein